MIPRPIAPTVPNRRASGPTTGRRCRKPPPCFAGRAGFAAFPGLGDLDFGGGGAFAGGAARGGAAGLGGGGGGALGGGAGAATAPGGAAGGCASSSSGPNSSPQEGQAAH